MRAYTLFCIVLLLTACKTDDPIATPDGAPRPDAPIIDADTSPDAPGLDANPGCEIPATDYTPRDNGSASDSWAACISDDNAYHPFDVSISTLARIGAFENIAALLFTGAAPSEQNFIDARVEYNQTQGLASRVQRREDFHYPPPVDGNGAPLTCQILTPTELATNADYCVGLARISPLLETAFGDGQSAGATELQRRVAAARIEAGLLWFLYMSVYKEVTTCTGVPRDCDSGWAYYTGGDARDLGKGLSRYVRALDVDTHDRIWDGLLAVRCWRDLDNPTGVAVDLAMRDLARAQLDAAALRGLAQIVGDRTTAFAAAAGDPELALWELLRVLGPVLDREAMLRDAGIATLMRSAFSQPDAAQVDPDAIISQLDALFPCP